MRKTYRILAGTIAVLVVIQAAMIAYAFSGLTTWVMDGATLDAATIEGWDDEPPTFEGFIGGFFHFFLLGTVLIPLLGLVLLIVSFFAKVPKGVPLAAAVFGTIVVQYLLGTFSAGGVPILGLLHGLNAFIIIGAAAAAAKAASSTADAPEAPAAVV